MDRVGVFASREPWTTTPSFAGMPQAPFTDDSNRSRGGHKEGPATVEFASHRADVFGRETPS
jgi:hypothetical protein